MLLRLPSRAQPLSRGRSTDSRGPVWYLFWGRWRSEKCREGVFGRVGMKVKDGMRVRFCWGMKGWKVIFLIWVGRECGECGGLGWFLIHEWVGVACWEFCCEWMICSHELFLCLLFYVVFYLCEKCSGRGVFLGCSWGCCKILIVFCIWGGLLVWWVDVWHFLWVVMRKVWGGFGVGGFWFLSGVLIVGVLGAGRDFSQSCRLYFLEFVEGGGWGDGWPDGVGVFDDGKE